MPMNVEYSHTDSIWDGLREKCVFEIRCMLSAVPAVETMQKPQPGFRNALSKNHQQIFL